MILLNEFLELVGNEPTCFPLTHDEYKDLRDQEKLQRMLNIQKLEIKFNDNPNKKTATALSNARIITGQSPVDIAWRNSPDYKKVKTAKEMRDLREISELCRDVAGFHNKFFN